MAVAVQEHLKERGVQTRYIEPGAPWQNAYPESTGSRLRDELLDRELFTSRIEAQVLCEDYQRIHNTERPQSALGYKPPVTFAANYQPATTPNQVPALN